MRLVLRLDSFGRVGWRYGWPAIISETFFKRITARMVNAAAAKSCSIREVRESLKKERHPRQKSGKTTTAVYQVVQPHAHAVSDIQTKDPTTKSHSVIAEDALRRDLRRFESSCEMAASIFRRTLEACATPNNGGAPCQMEGIESPKRKRNKAAVRRRHRRLVLLPRCSLGFAVWAQ